MPRRKPAPSPASVASEDDPYADDDDADSIAHAMQQDAIADREWSQGGLLRSLAHGAAYEHSACNDCVIDPALVDQLALRKEPGAAAIVESSIGELRRWLDAPSAGKQQRARYALVRFLGPESDVAVEGLLGTPAAQVAVLQALDNPIATEDPEAPSQLLFPVLPASLLPGLGALIDPRAARKLVKKGSWQDLARIVRLILRIDAEEVSTLLLGAMEVEALRPTLLEQLVARPRGRHLASVSAQVRARFERAADIIEASRTAGLPSRVEMTVAGTIATLVGRDRAMAKRALQILDLVSGATGTAEALKPLVALITASIDRLDAPELAHLASLMIRGAEAQLPAAAAAWVRLDPVEAKALARSFKEGTAALEAKRWVEAARAQRARPDPDPAITALLVEGLLGKARNGVELDAAIEGAAAIADGTFLPAVLKKLRDVPFRIDAKLEARLASLIEPENEDLVADEIDGENPFRDRREALDRALKAARARGAEKSR